jgi:hypothetical protein
MTSAPSLEGVWTYRSLSFPGHQDFICIDEVRGRIVSFYVMSLDPLHYAPMYNWYRPESAKAIATRLRLDGEWQTHVVRSAGDQLLLIHNGGPHVWKRLPSAHYPEWLPGRLEAANKKMDEDEKKLRRI